MKINDPVKNNSQIKKIIEKVKINLNYLKKNQDFREYIYKNISSDQKILDVGQSMRHFSMKIKSKNSDTLDINSFEGYPNIQADLCEKNLSQLIKSKYDVIICLAVLEHCYNPFEATKNIYEMIMVFYLDMSLFYLIIMLQQILNLTTFTDFQKMVLATF